MIYEGLVRNSKEFSKLWYIFSFADVQSWTERPTADPKLGGTIASE